MFHDEDKAREYFETQRWPDSKPFCVHCGSTNVHRLEGKSHRPGLIQWNDCLLSFTVTTKSVMESSHVPLAKWALAFHKMAASKKGISAKQMQRELALGSYRTAWFVCMRVREAMKLPKMAKGEYIATVAIAEAAGRFDAGGIELKAGKKGADYTLSGEKFFVPDAHVADCIVVAARSSGSGEEGVTLLMVPAKQKGVTITQLKTVDMTRRLCHVKFDGVTVPAANLLGKEGQGWPILRRTLDIATAALSAEMVGTAQKALDIAVDYAKTRVQFGKPIGSFQAVKHKCVDMMVAVENTRSLTYYACWTVDERLAEAATAVPMAKAYASDMAKNVTSEAIQVHGGIGFTWEHDLHLYFKRAKGSEFTFGDATWHRERVAQLVNL
jgi:alkylation response protein AidB-like acyl-CoA dehydrogenase